MSRGLKLTAIAVLLGTALLALGLELAPFLETASIEARLTPPKPEDAKRSFATLKRFELKNTSSRPFWIRVNRVAGSGIRHPNQFFITHAARIGNPQPFHPDLGVMLKANQSLSMWLRESENITIEDFALRVDLVATPATKSSLVSGYERLRTHGPKFMRSAPAIIKAQSVTCPVAPATP